MNPWMVAQDNYCQQVFESLVLLVRRLAWVMIIISNVIYLEITGSKRWKQFLMRVLMRIDHIVSVTLRVETLNSLEGKSATRLVCLKALSTKRRI